MEVSAGAGDYIGTSSKAYVSAVYIRLAERLPPSEYRRNLRRLVSLRAALRTSVGSLLREKQREASLVADQGEMGIA